MTDKDQIQPIITAYLSGKATAEERRKLDDWVKQSPDNDRYYQEIRNIWQVMHPAFTPSEIHVFEAEKKVLANIATIRRNIARTLIIYWQRMAAVLVIPLLIICTYLFLEKDNGVYDAIEYQEVKSPHGTFSEVRLPDGTNVWLNGGSTLKYPLTFRKGERDVFLNGEGYFEVNKATEWPFIVNAEQMRVKVTGTKFNVKSYSTEPIAHTTLVEGSVWTYTDQTQVQLNPSEQFQYDKETGKTSVQKVDTELYTGWIEGMFVFRNQRLEDVMSDLARWYNMTIFYSTAETKEIRISTNLNRYKNIDDLLEIINESGKVVAARKDNTITIHTR